ncbi:MAG TPA: acetate--CoA ligase family protein [Beijerinckiaceae bacterium]
MSVADNIDALLAPRNVVLVGASDRNWSGRVHESLRRLGFGGRVFLVNPNRAELWGERCFAGLGDLPEPPDHLAVFLPADQTLDLLDAAQGARSASLYAAGFGEGGEPEGLARAARLRASLARSRIAAVGPNCMGLAVGRARLCTIPDEQIAPLEPGPVAVLTQSGMLAQTMSRGVESAGLPLAYLISCGNQIGLTFADYVDRLAEDPELRVIACYAEATPDAPRFFAAARKAREAGKSVVVVKIGGSAEARRAALAHTGALAGSHAAFDAVAREAGVVRLDTLEDMIEAVAFLARAPRPKGRRIAAMTNSGALKSLLTEGAEASGAVFPALEARTHERLRAALPDAEPATPFDTKRTLPTDVYMACVQALHDDANIDAVLLAEELPRAPGVERKLKNFQALDAWLANAPGKPVAAFSPVALRETDYMRDTRLGLTRTPWLRDLTKAMRVVARLADEDLPPLAPPPPAAERAALVARVRARAAAADDLLPLAEGESKALLAAYGLRMPEEEIVADGEAAVAAAARIGWPVVLKGVSAAVPHKSDAGLVLLNLQDAAQVRDAARTIAERCAALGAPLEGVLVARQMTGGVEMVVGLHRDPEVGPVVMVGMGGVWLEVFSDAAFGPPGLDEARARRMIERLKAARLLAGYRGAPAGDVGALARAVVALGAMAVELGDCLESVDVNPILVRPDGAFALDGLVVLRNGNKEGGRTP